jgi:hypothetical protein
MAVLRGEISFNLKPLADMARQFPSFGGRLLAFFGSKARTLLKEEYLSGQEINLNKFPRDAMGRYTITSDVNRARTSVKIYSYPVNLFEKGRRLRNGRKEPPKRIIGTKLKQAVASRSSTYVSDFENRILNPEIKKAGF